MVAAEHWRGAEVGAGILARGGNAVDAAVATAFAMTVIEPFMSTIGGSGTMLVHLARKGETLALNFNGIAPLAGHEALYRVVGGVSDGLFSWPRTENSANEFGHRAVAVPGSVAGLSLALERYGTMELRDVLAPAIALARDGFEADWYLALNHAKFVQELSAFPVTARNYLREGKYIYRPAGMLPGDRPTYPDLARSLELIAKEGPDAFYRGAIAQAIVADMAANGGLITREDLAGYRPKWRTPIQVGYRGYTIYSMPPASSGGVTMGEMLNMLEGYDTLPPFGSAGYVHLETEIMRRAFIDRNHWLGDPDFVSMPLDRLLSKSYAASLRADIDPRHATPTPPAQSGGDELLETTHYSVVDAAGNAASVTTTLNGGFGSAVTVTGAGFLLNNEMDDFTTAPGKPNQYGLVQGEANAIVPGKRMLSAMTPSIVLGRDGKLFMVVGTPGGPTIITSVFQVIVNVVDQGMSLAAAVAAPRIHHQALPDVVFYERNSLAGPVVDSLKAMGHALRMRGYSGDIAAIERTATGWVGVADPRRGGGAAGY